MSSTIRNYQSPNTFYFKNLSKQQMVEILDDDYPINLVEYEDIVNRIHIKYPVATKPEIALVVKTTFQFLRKFLILGRVINFYELVYNMKLLFCKRLNNRNGNEHVIAKVSLSTPDRFKTVEYGEE